MKLLKVIEAVHMESQTSETGLALVKDVDMMRRVRTARIDRVRGAVANDQPKILDELFAKASSAEVVRC